MTENEAPPFVPPRQFNDIATEAHGLLKAEKVEDALALMQDALAGRKGFLEKVQEVDRIIKREIQQLDAMITLLKLVATKGE